MLLLQNLGGRPKFIGKGMDSQACVDVLEAKCKLVMCDVGRRVSQSIRELMADLVHDRFVDGDRRQNLKGNYLRSFMAPQSCEDTMEAKCSMCCVGGRIGQQAGELSHHAHSVPRSTQQQPWPDQEHGVRDHQGAPATGSSANRAQNGGQ